MSFDMQQLNHSSLPPATMVSQAPPTLTTMVDFRERLSAAMEHAGVASGDLAAFLKISPQALRKIEVGTSKSLSAENCAKAARHLRVDHYWLATGEGEMAPRLTCNIEKPVHTETAYAVHDTGPLNQWPAWPFQTVPPVDYARLTERQKGVVEGYARALIDANTNHPQHARPRAA
jgi:hypothetical protein